VKGRRLSRPRHCNVDVRHVTAIHCIHVWLSR